MVTVRVRVTVRDRVRDRVRVRVSVILRLILSAAAGVWAKAKTGDLSLADRAIRETLSWKPPVS